MTKAKSGLEPSPPRELWVDMYASTARMTVTAYTRPRNDIPGDVRYTLAEPPREPTAAELDELARLIADRVETLPDGRPGDSWDDYDEILRDVWRKTALLAWHLGARPKPEGA